MTVPFANTPKKDVTETEPTPAQASDSNENVEAKPDDAEKKGQHGEDFCCGSCS